MQTLPFKQVGVFTLKPFLGDPVAVVIGATGLATQAMQRIAAWTNLSETTFVLPPSSQRGDYRLRIFTPKQELPFAGHPTVGSAPAVMESGFVLPDPYPYILLNLVLSCLAAIQAPIIMMSQNRLEARDRLRSEQDYQVNLKAELEIRHLHEKLDVLLKHQWKKLLEVQQIQLDLMKELASAKGQGVNPLS
jgi:PhzF family phenazine biosynthesis protein